jgi:hypothetical protein
MAKALGRAPKIGDKGTLWSGRLHVIQVVDDQNLLGKIEWYDGYVAAIPGQYVDTRKEHLMNAWITMPTKGMVDDSLVETDQVFEVVGTKSYQAAIGKRTVLHFKVVEEGSKTKGK